MLLPIPQSYGVKNTPILFQEIASDLELAMEIHPPYGLQTQHWTRPTRECPRGSDWPIVLRLAADINGNYLLQYVEIKEQTNHEIMNVSLQNEPLPSNVSIKSSRYRVTRNLIYHSHKRSPVKVRVQKDRITIV
jgi:hypothetical protein